jgi:hypothetical protein
MCQLKYFGMTVKSQDLIQEEIRKKLNSGNTCCHSVQDLLSSHLLFKTVNIKICEILILDVFLCGHETLSLILREELKSV